MYMKKNFFYAAALAMGLTFSMTACSDDDTPKEPVDVANIDYTSENATSWNNYMMAVATLLCKDASDLYRYWAKSYEGGESYAETFKKHGAPFNSALTCVQQSDRRLCGTLPMRWEKIKIGDPYSKYQAGKKTEPSMR